ncbi:MAG TPA: nucleoside monophosphate kinase [Phycisphaerae bacterium]|nr:nucleoside monophosphate kinase [Phycisphaerae bacterium]
MSTAGDKPSDRNAARHAAILLIGPTGSGKTPLGNLLEARGLWGRRCVHFDFGASLRACAAGAGHGAGLTRGECTLLAQMLESEALLEDEHFRIAENVLRSFLADRDAGPQTLVVLNGLPRHVGQATDMKRVVRVEALVHLSCPPKVIRERVRTNAGGDRTDRSDDDARAVAHKMAVFQERTAPLVAYYRDGGTPVITIGVAADTTADAMWQRLNESPPNRA